jgi:hypothetical protein
MNLCCLWPLEDGEHPFCGRVRRAPSKKRYRAAAVHPGDIRTEIARCVDPGCLEALVDDINKQLATAGKPPFEFKTIAQGAATSVRAGVVAPADEIGGRYCENCHVGNIVPDDVPLYVSEGVRGYAQDPNNATHSGRGVKNYLGSFFRDSV